MADKRVNAGTSLKKATELNRNQEYWYELRATCVRNNITSIQAVDSSRRGAGYEGEVQDQIF